MAAGGFAADGQAVFVVDPEGGVAQGVGLFDHPAEVVVDVVGLGAEGFDAGGISVAGADFLDVAQGDKVSPG